MSVHIMNSKPSFQNQSYFKVGLTIEDPWDQKIWPKVRRCDMFIKICLCNIVSGWKKCEHMLHCAEGKTSSIL